MGEVDGVGGVGLPVGGEVGEAVERRGQAAVAEVPMPTSPPKLMVPVNV